MSNEFQIQASQRDKLIEKWGEVLEHKNYPEIKSRYKQGVVAQLLENQFTAFNDARSHEDEADYLTEAAPTNSGGVGVALGGEAGANQGTVAGFDPILISLVRRAMPQLIAYDICGVQPMTQPTGLIFAMKAKYNNQSGQEELFNEADTEFSGKGTHGQGPNVQNDSTGNNPNTTDDETQGRVDGIVGGASKTDPFAADYTAGYGLRTAEGERLGQGGTGDGDFGEMAFTIDKTSVAAFTRALKAEYSIELAQDLKAVHGLDAEGELSNILSREILFEINREIVRTIYRTAKLGAQVDVQNQGTFDMDVDSDGRWLAEKFKGLLFQIDRDSNAIGHETRRGRGNFIICSADVGSALQQAGVLDYAPALSTQGLNIDDTSSTYAGVLNGRYKVFIDPYTANISSKQFFCVGYKGNNPMDAGIFYAPYVPLQMVRAVDPDSFQPRIGFKTRYGLVANPFVELDDTQKSQIPTSTQDAHRNLHSRSNYYYRIVAVENLL